MRSAFYLTCLPAGLLLRFLALDGLSHVVADGGPLVLRPGRASGAGPGRFRRAGGNGQVLADAAEPPANAGRGETAGRARLLPGQPDVGREVAGEPELGVGGDDEPGPPVGGMRGLYSHVSDRMRQELKDALQARFEESLKVRFELARRSLVPALDELLTPLRG